ncbi:MAG TPA: MaoC family dehydratase [Anaeromyxobacteraceae bacterium]|nr:MaoC family dehydratase [Anaeromyxobacteraceae bacterium]
MSEARYYWEDFPVGKVREFGGVAVTAEEIVRFARQFDPQPFHLDEEAAKRSAFGGLVASGWHTCALAMRMECDAYLSDTASAGSPGVDALRWLRPVRPGDVLRVRTTVVEARPLRSKPHLGLVRKRWEVLNQHGEPVMEMIGSAMLLRRPAG